MSHIDGNEYAVVQIKKVTRDEYQADKAEWKSVYILHGVLDLLAAGTNLKMMRRIEDSDHIFLCDYFVPEFEGEKLTAENSRLMIGDEIYEVQLFDDVMGLHEHMEIYLKYLGG